MFRLGKSANKMSHLPWNNAHAILTPDFVLLSYLFSALPLLPRLGPFLFPEDLSDQLLHIRALLEFEHVPKPSLLGSNHGFLRSPMAVPAQKYGPAPLRESVQKRPQFRLRK